MRILTKVSQLVRGKTVVNPRFKSSEMYFPNFLDLASQVDQTVKHLPAIQETRVQSLGGEDPLEKEMSTHCSILAWKIPWTEEPGRPQSMGSQSRTQLKDFTFTFYFILLCPQGVSCSVMSDSLQPCEL